MGSLGTIVKRFITNKNTVTLAAILVSTVLLYIVYNNRVNSQTSTVMTCYAREIIEPRTQITENMVGSVRILSSQVTSNMITNCGSIIGKYVSYATEVAQNSYFYKSMVMEESEMPDAAFGDMLDNYTPFRLPVTFESTYGNSIFPGNKIDLFVRTTDESGKLVFGKFIQSITVSAVKDSEGKNVFETTKEARTPSQLLFNVPDDLFLLLSKAQMLGIEILVVPRNNNYTAKQGEVLVSSEYIKTLIEDQTAVIPDECVASTTGTAECRLASSYTDNTNNETSTDNTAQQ